MAPQSVTDAVLAPLTETEAKDLSEALAAVAAGEAGLRRALGGDGVDHGLGANHCFKSSGSVQQR